MLFCLLAWALQLNSAEERLRCLQAGCSWGLQCKFLFSSLRDLYSQFLKEMIIQPGIAKANLGVSREDVTLEDHVSAVKPLCCSKSLWATDGCVEPRALGHSWLSAGAERTLLC